MSRNFRYQDRSIKSFAKELNWSCPINVLIEVSWFKCAKSWAKCQCLCMVDRASARERLDSCLIYEILEVQYSIYSIDVDLNLSSIYAGILNLGRTNIKTVIANRWFRTESMIKCHARSLPKLTDRLVAPWSITNFVQLNKVGLLYLRNSTVVRERNKLFTWLLECIATMFSSITESGTKPFLHIKS